MVPPENRIHAEVYTERLGLSRVRLGAVPALPGARHRAGCDHRQEADLPLLSELLLANLLHEGGRPVTIVARRWTAMLRGTGEFSAWIHLPRN